MPKKLSHGKEHFPGKFGSGERTKHFVKKLKKSGKVRNPEAVAAAVGRGAHGKEEYQKAAARGRARARKARGK
jgi:hypothetical protein